MLPLTDDFKEIVLNERPLIDLRAPVEYQKGSFPNSINLPLMTDEEREQVGICYKEKGHDAALTLGHELVQGEKKEERLQNWTTFIDAHPDTLLFCFRGGNRSEIVQQWIFEKTQKKVPRLTGGYKKFRHYLMDSLNPQNISTKPLILTGFTGSGKTEILKQFEHAIDLEGLANHRGSSFGGKISSQPTQVNFENKLAYQIIQHQHKQFAVLLLEDESRNIGRNYLPKDLFNYFQQGPLVLLQVPLEKRVDNIFHEYVLSSQKKHRELYGESGLDLWHDGIEESLHRIKKRMDPVFFKETHRYLEQAYEDQKANGDLSLHKKWVELLLTQYYDPMYSYQIKRKKDRIVLTADQKEVETYLKAQKKKL